MFFFNLSFIELLTIASAVSGLVVALYLLDRSRRRVLAATLKFWTAAERPVESTRRRRIRQWPSLLLTLLSLLCLLLAIAQLRFGSPENLSRDHVLIVDTSSWMAARSGNEALIDQARRQALAYLRAIPSSDRVMVIHADALATPATPFDADRRNLEKAIRAARPSSAALDLQQALDFARSALRRGARRPGEIVFAGAGRFSSTENSSTEPRPSGSGTLRLPPNLRLLPISATPQNIGLRRIGLRRSTAEANLWQVFVSVHNYGSQSRQADLALQFAGAPVGAKRLRLAPSSEQEAVFDLRTQAAGLLEARILSAADAFPADDRAVLEIPKTPPVTVTVCSDDPTLLRPLLDSHRGVQARYLSTANCGEAAGDIAIYDRFVPASPATSAAIYLEPPQARSPIAVRSLSAGTRLQTWLSSHPVTAGLRAQDLRLDSTLILAPASSDVRIAEASEGPVIVARDTTGSPRLVVFGFHPMRSQLRYELSIPLLFANILRWMSPSAFQRQELYAERVGAVSVPLENDTTSARVVTAEGSPVPYSISGSSLRFFSGEPGTVRVTTDAGEQVHSLVLPDVPTGVWEPPATARRGIPPAHENVATSRDIWQWLALAGGLGLLLEWIWFSPASPRAKVPAPPKRVLDPSSMRRAS